VLLVGVRIAKIHLPVLADLRDLRRLQLGEEPEMAILVRLHAVHGPAVKGAVRLLAGHHAGPDVPDELEELLSAGIVRAGGHRDSREFVRVPGQRSFRVLVAGNRRRTLTLRGRAL
jgi:hypothetical protein